MAQYRPSGLIPSTLTSSYSIDATVSNEFRCQINGASPTTSYRIVIMQNNTGSTVVYDSGVVNLGFPIYPTNFDGTSNELVVTVPSSSGMVNGGQYKWAITSYWSTNDYLESFENVFYAYSAPALDIQPIPSTINSKSHMFVANYSQAQGVAVERFGWILRNTATGQVIVDTISSGNIYSTNLRLWYDGFFSGESYEVKVKCWLANGIEIETDYESFDVEYVTAPFDGTIETETTCDSGIVVSWPSVNYILGDANGPYDYTRPWEEYIQSYCIDIPAGSSVVFDEVNRSTLEFTSNSTHVISFFMDKSSTVKTVYSAIGTDTTGNPFSIKLQYLESQFTLAVSQGVNVISTPVHTAGLYDIWYVVAISPTGVRFTTYGANLNGLMPAEDLYPDDDLYPEDMTYGPNVGGLYPSVPLYPGTTLYPLPNVYVPDGGTFVPVDIPINCVYNSLELYGAQETNYLWVLQGELSTAEWYHLSVISNEPVWTNDTMLLANFNESLSAGNFAGNSELIGWLVYRLDSGSPVLKAIAQTEPTVFRIADYSVVNQSSYKYYVFPIFEDGIGTALVSGSINTLWWDWILMVCNGDNDDYTIDKLYRFDLDVATGAMGNNTSFNVLENFTQYSKIQRSNANYWSGTLTALLGNCSNTYHDSVAQMNEMKALTTDRRIKFLKDRKGNLWKISLNSPVSQQVGDTFREQQVSLTLNWMEIGDARQSSIIKIDNIDTNC